MFSFVFLMFFMLLILLFFDQFHYLKKNKNHDEHPLGRNCLILSGLNSVPPK